MLGPADENTKTYVRSLMWLFVAMVVLTGGTTMFIATRKLDTLQQQRAVTEQARLLAQQSVDGLREYRIRLTHGLHTTLSDFRTHNAETSQKLDEILSCRFEEVTVQALVSDASDSISQLLGTTGLAIPELHRLKQNLSDVHAAVTEVILAALDNEITRKRLVETEELVRSNLRTIDLTLSQAIGRHRMATAKLFLALEQQAGSSQIDALPLPQLLTNVREHQRMRTLGDDLKQLALITEQLFAAQSLDEMRTLKDNRLRQVLSRLKREAGVLSERSGLFLSQLQVYQDSILGGGAKDDSAHQTMVCGAGGAYLLKKIRLSEHAQLQQSLTNAETIAARCRANERKIHEHVSALVIEDAKNSSSELTALSRTMYAVFGLVAVIFVPGAWYLVCLVTKTIDEVVSLRGRAERLALVAKHTDNGVIITDAKGRMEWVNDGFERLTGYSAAEVIGRTPGEVLQGSSSDPRARAYMGSRIRQGKAFNIEIVNYKKNGEEFIVAVDAMPLRDEAGNTSGYFAIERDLTEFRRTETRLAEESLRSEAQLEALDRMQGRVEFSPEGIIEDINVNFADTMGYTRDEILDQHHGMFVSEEVRESDEYIEFWKKLSNGDFHFGTFERLAKDGSSRWIQGTYFPLVDEHGKVYKIIKYAIDVTLRKRDEEEMQRLNRCLEQQRDSLANERRLLDTIINSVPAALFWKDTDLRYLGCNEVFAEVAGLEHPKQIAGLDDYDLPWSTEEADHYRTCDRQVMREELVILNHEESQTNASGEETVLWTSKTPLKDDAGQVVGMLGVFSDVTEVKQAQAERDQLMQSAAELANVIRESPNELYIVDAATMQFEDVNQGALEATGYALSEFQSMTPLDINPELDSESLEQFINKLKADHRRVVDMKSTHLRKDGTTYPVRVILHCAAYNNKDVIVAFVSDLTEFHRLEDQLSRAQKLESIGQLAAGIAHEINTPMQFVGDNIEYLSECSEMLFRVVDSYDALLDDVNTPNNWEDRRRAMRELTEECRFDHIRKQMPAAIEESREGVRRTVKIVRAMKAFSHPGTKQLAPGNLNELIESTVAISRNRWKYVAEMQLDLDPNLPEVPMLTSEINQVLLNLLVNAGDAIAEREDRLDNELGTIMVSTSEEPDWVVVEVQDDGCGIPESLKQKVFDPFFTTKEVGKGTGQGLAITHNVIVNQHGGLIAIETAPSGGTTFIVKLPKEAALQVEVPTAETTPVFLDV